MPERRQAVRNQFSILSKKENAMFRRTKSTSMTSFPQRNNQTRRAVTDRGLWWKPRMVSREVSSQNMSRGGPISPHVAAYLQSHAICCCTPPMAEKHAWKQKKRHSLSSSILLHAIRLISHQTRVCQKIMKSARYHLRRVRSSQNMTNYQ